MTHRILPQHTNNPNTKGKAMKRKTTNPKRDRRIPGVKLFERSGKQYFYFNLPAYAIRRILPVTETDQALLRAMAFEGDHAAVQDYTLETGPSSHGPC
jgi:hypothetical protein